MVNSRWIILDKGRSGCGGREELLLAQHADALDVGVVLLGQSELRRNTGLVSDALFCFGAVPWVSEAMRIAGVICPEHEPYPSAVAEFLGRRVWREPHLHRALDAANVRTDGIFVKPADGWKRFTGFVSSGNLERHDPRLNGYSRTRPVWCSEVMRIRSEWRAYVVDDRVEFVAPAPGLSDTIEPDRGVVERIAASLSGQRRGFVFDVAVIDTGGAPRTVLLEVNDGFSFGAYGAVSAAVIWDVVSVRWSQLKGSRHFDSRGVFNE